LEGEADLGFAALVAGGLATGRDTGGNSDEEGSSVHVLSWVRQVTDSTQASIAKPNTVRMKENWNHPLRRGK
jgi:hypothetical protein